MAVYQTVTGDNTAPCSLPVVDQHRGMLEVCTRAAAAKYKDATSTGKALWTHWSQGTQEKLQYRATSPQEIQTFGKPKAKSNGRKEPWKEHFQHRMTD